MFLPHFRFYNSSFCPTIWKWRKREPYSLKSRQPPNQKLIWWTFIDDSLLIHTDFGKRRVNASEQSRVVKTGFLSHSPFDHSPLFCCYCWILNYCGGLILIMIMGCHWYACLYTLATGVTVTPVATLQRALFLFKHSALLRAMMVPARGPPQSSGISHVGQITSKTITLSVHVRWDFSPPRPWRKELTVIYRYCNTTRRIQYKNCTMWSDILVNWWRYNSILS